MKRIIVLIICFSLLATLFTGCQKPAPKPGTTPPESGLTTSDRRVIADKLSKQARQIEGVQNATVVLAENNGNGAVTTSPTPGQTNAQGLIVMVGLTTKPGSDEARVKNQVVTKLKAADGRVSHVLVTTDPALIKKINDVAAGFLEGKPFQTMKDNINTINQEIKKENPVP
ncbi:MAG: YhcN/YlaJ family sporulation lipoprotein [Syntrophomonadaceae bacterium]|jgi:hypothetical protein